MANNFQLEIVTAENLIYSGMIEKLFVPGVMGDLEILPNHAPFLTTLESGSIWVHKDGAEEGFVIFGGMLEVQPKITIILADAALRASDLDEAAAIEARDASKRALYKKEAEFDYAKARAELSVAIARLKSIRKARKQVDSKH